MMALSAPVGRCAASFGEGQSPCPSRRVWANVGRLWEALRYKASGPFGMEPRDERKSRIKTGVAGGASGRSQLPAVRVVTGFAVYQKWGQKQAAGITFVVTIPELLLP